MLRSSGPGLVLGSKVANRVLAICLVQWLGWVFETQERKKESRSAGEGENAILLGCLWVFWTRKNNTTTAWKTNLKNSKKSESRNDFKNRKISEINIKTWDEQGKRVDDITCNAPQYMTRKHAGEKRPFREERKLKSYKTISEWV